MRLRMHAFCKHGFSDFQSIKYTGQGIDCVDWEEMISLLLCLSGSSSEIL
uniref:Uncharacterized protein n=1 Tax=Nelumbo nucifera TaxID=4432 RepID=A0A822Z9L0_NELNU|nr:TPA_asm: hypothetical protein HUJ06_001214 [Nelumbo nucifera]